MTCSESRVSLWDEIEREAFCADRGNRGTFVVKFWWALVTEGREPEVVFALRFHSARSGSVIWAGDGQPKAFEVRQ